MIKSYIQERYGNLAEDQLQLEEITQAYLQYLDLEGFKAVTVPGGFATYKLEGDACILNDMYTSPEARKKGIAWVLFSKIKDIANLNSKNVIISFSEYVGQNHQDGLGAMQAAGFKKAFDTRISQVFMRGVN